MATASIRRGYQGPAFFSYSFRPFFLFASIQAGLGFLLLLLMMMGKIRLPTIFAFADWHIHEMLFGYMGAVVSGFLLTAIPNQAGNPPVRGMPLMLLAASWVAGRIAVSMSAWSGWQMAMAIDMQFLVCVTIATAWEVCAAKKWRNLIFLMLVVLLLIANTGFHLEAHFNGQSDYSHRLGISVMLILVGLISWRIIPGFCRNRFAQQEPGRVRVRFGTVPYTASTLAANVGILLLWITSPDNPVIAPLIVLCVMPHGQRLAGWIRERTILNPVLAFLYIGYFFVIAGFVLTALPQFLAAGSFYIPPAVLGLAYAGLHLWTADVMLILSFAIMTRVSLVYTGRTLATNRPTLCIYGLVLAGVLAKIVSTSGYWWAELLYISVACWSLAFIGFAVVYWKALTGPRLKGGG